MKHLFKFIVLALLINTTTIQAQWFGNKNIKGNGKITTIERQTNPYNSIRCAGSFNYILVSGTEGKLSLKGDENILPYITTEVKNGVLTIKTEKNISLNTSRNNTIEIRIPFEDIDAVSLSGSGDLWNENPITASNFNISLSGSGDIELDVQASNIESVLTGSGDIKLIGKANELKTKVTGSGDFDGSDLTTEDVQASVTGSGNIKVSNSGVLKARVTGSGDIEYKGNPKKVDSKVVGSGSIGY